MIIIPSDTIFLFFLSSNSQQNIKNHTMIFDILFTHKKYNLKLWNTFPIKKWYFSLEYGTKIEKTIFFSILGISTMEH